MFLMFDKNLFIIRPLTHVDFFFKGLLLIKDCCHIMENISKLDLTIFPVFLLKEKKGPPDYSQQIYQQQQKDEPLEKSAFSVELW